MAAVGRFSAARSGRRCWCSHGRCSWLLTIGLVLLPGISPLPPVAPYGRSARLLHHFVALVAGLVFPVALNQLLHRGGDWEAPGSMAREAARLRRLVIGYPDGERAAQEVPTLYEALPELVRDYPRSLKALLEEANEAGVLVNQRCLADALPRNPTGAGHSEGGSRSDEPALVPLRCRGLERALVPLDEATPAGRQRQANRFHPLGLIGEWVNVRDAGHSRRTRQSWTS
jgi:hypothetical protein